MATTRCEVDVTTPEGRMLWEKSPWEARFIDSAGKYWVEGRTMEILPPCTLVYSPDPLNRVTLWFPDQDSAIIFFEWCLKMGHAEEVT